jgi:hypothetical protein
MFHEKHIKKVVLKPPPALPPELLAYTRFYAGLSSRIITYCIILKQEKPEMDNFEENKNFKKC